MKLYLKFYCCLGYCLLLLASMLAGGGHSFAFATTRDTYTISFAQVKGESIASVEVAYGQLPANPTGVFAPSLFGFFSEEDGNGILYYIANPSKNSGTNVVLKSTKIFDIKQDIALYPYIIPTVVNATSQQIIINPNGGMLSSATKGDNIETVYKNTPLRNDRLKPTKLGYKFMGYYSNIGNFNKDDSCFDVDGDEWYDKNMQSHINPSDINLNKLPRYIHAKWIKDDGSIDGNGEENNGEENNDNTEEKHGIDGSTIAVVLSALVVAFGITYLGYFIFKKTKRSR